MDFNSPLFSFFNIPVFEPFIMSHFFPQGLTEGERQIYNTMASVQRNRQVTGTGPPNIVIITDIAKDYDDLIAMILLKELDRLKLIKLLGFVANLSPVEQRAVYGRGALNSLGLHNLPISVGTNGISSAPNSPAYVEHSYEFTGQFYLELKDKPAPTSRGTDFLTNVCQAARASGNKITFLLISSLKDISSFTTRHGSLFRSVVSNVVLQGGYSYQNNILTPNLDAANNKIDIPSAIKFHTFLTTHKIKSSVYTKHAAFSVPLTTQLFKDLAATTHILGEHLEKVQIAQDKEFYTCACLPNPAFMNAETFLKNKTSWYNTHTQEDAKPDPRTEEILTYLTKAVVYDALPALGAAGEDLSLALGVWGDDQARVGRSENGLFEVFGVSVKEAGEGKGETVFPCINGKRMADVLAALLKGSLLASVQGITEGL